MKIVIDGRMLYWTGVGRYTQRLLENLERLDRENHYYVLIREADWDRWKPSQPNFTRVRTKIDPYTVDEQTKLIREIRSLRPDLVHFLAPNSPILYRGARVTTVHDLTLLDYDTSRGSGLKRWLRGLKRIPFRFVLRQSLHKSAHILTPTKYVAGELKRRFRIPNEIISTAPLGSDPVLAAPASLQRFRVDGPFLFYYGNYYPYKNVASTIKALALAADSQPKLQLVLAGKPDSYGDELMALAKSLGVEDRVHFVGFVSDGELVGLCRAAKLFVIPSLSEGFGLPGLEAMAQGLPVLAARASCLPEVYGDAAAYFDPYDAQDQAKQIGRLLGDKTLLEGMSAKGRARADAYSWERMTKQTMVAYKAVGSR